MTLLSLITGKLAPYLMAGVAALVALFGAYFKGRRDSHAARDAKDAKAKIETMETAKDVKDAVAAKTDAARRADLSRWVRPD